MKRYFKIGFSVLLVLMLLLSLPFGAFAVGTDTRDGLELMKIFS